MTAGNQPNTGFVNQQAGSLAVSLRNLMENIVNFNTYITAMGGATFLTGLGFTTADADTIVSTYGNLASLAGIYSGQASSVQLPFNFEANTNTLWGAQ